MINTQNYDVMNTNFPGVLHSILFLFHSISQCFFTFTKLDKPRRRRRIMQSLQTVNNSCPRTLPSRSQKALDDELMLPSRNQKALDDYQLGNVGWHIGFGICTKSHRDLSNCNASCCALDTIGEPLSSEDTPSWFHNVLADNGEIIRY